MTVRRSQCDEEVFADRLTVRVCLALLRKRLTRRNCPAPTLRVLDGHARGPLERPLEWALRIAGCEIREAEFFAGTLRREDGEAVRIAARRAGSALAFDVATTLTRDRSWLAALNRVWGRNTLTLYLARQMWDDCGDLLLRVMVAQALARTPSTAIVYVRWPAALPLDLEALRRVGVDVETRFAGWKTPRLGGRPAAASAWLLRRWLSLPRRATEVTPRPSVLLLQEDDVSLDPACRRQPHWISPGDAPAFRTLILRYSQLFSVREGAARLAEEGIEVLDEHETMRSCRGATSVGRALRRLAAALALRAWISPSRSARYAAARVARLAAVAGDLTDLCVTYNVRTFVAGESYLLHADAMLIAAEPLGVRTITYQYSNLVYRNVIMSTTADTMLTFSPLFEERWSWPGIQWPRFTEIGYLYDSVFPNLARPASERRARLTAAGARFVIGVFDENVQDDRYGLIHIDEYAAQLLKLLELLETDRTLGVIIKSQFHRSMERGSARISAPLQKALSTGRLEIPAAGNHRNSVLPAEVAQSCDVVIGNIVGGTASLEAALTGCRSVLLSEYGLRTANDALYAKVDVVYPDLDAALRAIQRFRAGDPAASGLGDWSPILPAFDRFRDGGAARRLQEIVGAATLPGASC